MQRIFLLFILFSIVYAQYHLGTHLKRRISDPKVHEEIYKHTHNGSITMCKKFDDEFKNATKETVNCLHLHYEPEKHNLCHFMITEFKPCVKPIIVLLKSCIPPKSKDTPEFFVDSLVDLMKFSCKAKGSQLLELSQPCIIFSLSDGNSTCQLMDYQNEFPTKTEICTFEKSYGDCLKAELQRECRSGATIDNFFNFYNAFLKPCKPLIK